MRKKKLTRTARDLGRREVHLNARHLTGKRGASVSVTYILMYSSMGKVVYMGRNGYYGTTPTINVSTTQLPTYAKSTKPERKQS